MKAVFACYRGCRVYAIGTQARLAAHADSASAPKSAAVPAVLARGAHQGLYFFGKIRGGGERGRVKERGRASESARATLHPGGAWLAAARAAAARSRMFSMCMQRLVFG